MVDYETFCRIRDHLARQQLTPVQTARALGLDVRTVAKWVGVEQYRARQAVPRSSKLDAFKGQIVRWLDVHPYSAQQVFQRLAEAGYAGGAFQSTVAVARGEKWNLRARTPTNVRCPKNDHPQFARVRTPRCGDSAEPLAPTRTNYRILA